MVTIACQTQVPREMGKIAIAAFVLLLSVPLDASQRIRPLERRTEYMTSPLERGGIKTVVQATGELRALRTIDVGSELSGRVSEVYVDFNDVVTAGEPLARLDSETFDARLNEAKASLRIASSAVLMQRASLNRGRAMVDNARLAISAAEAEFDALRSKAQEAETQFARKTALARAGAVSDTDLRNARVQRDVFDAQLRSAVHQLGMKEKAAEIAAAEQAICEASVANAKAVEDQKQAALQQSEIDLRRTVIRAPIDGVIIGRAVNPGEIVAVSLETKTLFKIAHDLKEMVVHGKIDEADVGELRTGQTVKFTVDAFPNLVLEGKLRQLRKASETIHNVVAYTTIISAPNDDLALLPGMTANVQIVTRETEDVLKVPNVALRFRPQLSDVQDESMLKSSADEADGQAAGRLWILQNDGSLKAIYVVLGRRDEQMTEVIHGSLSVGQQVVVGRRSSPGLTRAGIR